MVEISDEIYEHTTTWMSFKGHKKFAPIELYVNTLLDWRLNLMTHRDNKELTPDKLVIIMFEIEATTDTRITPSSD